jgi:hypothetical protein
MEEPLEYMTRSELQLNIMRNIERKVNELPKRNSFRWWWDNSKNWIRVQELLNMNTKKAGSTSSTAQCRFIGTNPDGYTFF